MNQTSGTKITISDEVVALRVETEELSNVAPTICDFVLKTRVFGEKNVEALIESVRNILRSVAQRAGESPSGYWVGSLERRVVPRGIWGSLITLYYPFSLYWQKAAQHKRNQKYHFLLGVNSPPVGEMVFGSQKDEHLFLEELAQIGGVAFEQIVKELGYVPQSKTKQLGRLVFEGSNLYPKPARVFLETKRGQMWSLHGAKITWDKVDLSYKRQLIKEVSLVSGLPESVLE